MSNMLFEISYIDKQGEIENSRWNICGQQFESMIHVMKYRSKKSYVYDATLHENITNSQFTSLTQHLDYNTDRNVSNYDLTDHYRNESWFNGNNQYYSL